MFPEATFNDCILESLVLTSQRDRAKSFSFASLGCCVTVNDIWIACKTFERAPRERPLWNQPNIQVTPKSLISHTPLIFFIELSTEHFLEGSVVIVSADLIFGHGILRLYTSPPPGSLPH